MLYGIDPILTNDNFSTKSNQNISHNEQYYTAQLYMNFIEKDYEHCDKNIFCHDKDYRRKLQCYNTWYINCMVFVRDNQSCKIYQDSEREYLHYLWLKNKTIPFSCEDVNKIRYSLNGIINVS